MTAANRKHQLVMLFLINEVSGNTCRELRYGKGFGFGFFLVGASEQGN